MALAQLKTLSILAPAKINLFLHVMGRRDDGLHLLDSLVSFTDIGDEIKIEPAQGFSFRVKGPFAGDFPQPEHSSLADSQNIVVKAAYALAHLAGQNLDCEITLQKNLPLASGIGGGSSDAAACLWGLMKFWDISAQAPFIEELLLSLGADLPVCFSCNTARMRGIGEDISPLRKCPEVPIILVNPGQQCSTAEIFKDFIWPEANALKGFERFEEVGFEDVYQLSAFLKTVDNHLYKPALARLPILAELLSALEATEGALISRMSGSGATCFAFYADEDAAQRGAEQIMINHPHWWVKAGWLNRPVRY
jgi:4-diphosphocytidyl-2-C-methyl-D-erythritol kinase